MSKLAMTKDAPAVVQVAVDRVFAFTPPADCTINIGDRPAGEVAHDCRYAQLRGGVTYRFVTSAADQYVTVLSRKDPGQLDYVDSGPKPTAIVAPVAVDEPK